MTEPQPQRIHAGGTIMALAMTSSDLVYLLVRTATGSGQLVCLDLRGELQGRFDLPSAGSNSLGRARCTLRVGGDGSAWLGNHDVLLQVGPDGQMRGRRELPTQVDESLASFLLLSDGLVVSFFKPSPAKVPGARVILMDHRGTTRWSIPLQVGDVEYEGIVEMSVESRWQPSSKKAWRPRDWQPSYDEPLLLSGERLLASYFEMSSGIGCSHCLDCIDGKLLWTTPRRPSSSLAIAGPGEFLVGVQGYGAFDTYRYGPDGTVRQHWPSHAYLLVREDGQIRGVEMENSIPSQMHFSVFSPNGKVRKGPHLDAYYTTYPVMSTQGVAAFWRDGTLWTVDEQLGSQAIWQEKSLANKMIMSRMLLADDGTLVFGLDDELILMPTGLGPMARGPWPCGSGNKEANPVFPTIHPNED